MWMVEPGLLCRKHLLGEHVECHMLEGSLRKGISVKGFVEKQLVEIQSLQSRHGLLAGEMVRRGYRHKSPLAGIPDRGLSSEKIDPRKSLRELQARCAECKNRIEKG
jgi:hypothetical protein